MNYISAFWFVSGITGIYLELGPGHLVEPGYLFQNYSDYDAQFHHPKAIYFRALVVPSYDISLKGESWFMFDDPVDLNLSDGPSTGEEFLEGLRAKRWEVIYLGSISSLCFFLVIQWHGSLAFRVGMMTGTSWGFLDQKLNWGIRSFRLE